MSITTQIVNSNHYITMDNYEMQHKYSGNLSNKNSAPDFFDLDCKHWGREQVVPEISNTTAKYGVCNWICLVSSLQVSKIYLSGGDQCQVERNWQWLLEDMSRREVSMILTSVNPPFGATWRLCLTEASTFTHKHKFWATIGKVKASEACVSVRGSSILDLIFEVGFPQFQPYYV